MLAFLHRCGPRSPSAAIRRALGTDGLPPGTDVDALGVVVSPGRYSGRKVTYFRIFDPKRAAARAVDVFTDYTYQDLDAHPDLVLRAGFVEQDGTVKVTARPATVEAAISTREQADRSQYRDDEKVVFPDHERPPVREGVAS